MIIKVTIFKLLMICNQIIMLVLSYLFLDLCDLSYNVYIKTLFAQN